MLMSRSQPSHTSTSSQLLPHLLCCHSSCLCCCSRLCWIRCCSRLQRLCWSPRCCWIRWYPCCRWIRICCSWICLLSNSHYNKPHGTQTTRNDIMILPHRTSHVSLCFVDFCCASLNDRYLLNNKVS